MKQFFKFMFASALGFIVAGGVLILIFFISMIAMISSIEGSFSTKKEVKVKENSVLHLKLDNRIVDRAERNPFADMDFGPFSEAGQTGLNDLLSTLDKAADDDKIKGIYLDVSSFPGGLGTLDELRNALIDFKDRSGKWILTYSNYYSQGGYYLASAGDRVYLYPEGAMDWKGLGSSIMFFKNMLDKLDIDIQVFRGRDNKFKSAVEPFMNEEMSEANREQMLTLLTSIKDHLLANIDESRAIGIDNLNLYADSLMINSPEAAMNLGFIHDLKYKDEFLAELRDSVNVEDEKDFNLISWSKYRGAGKPDLKMLAAEDKKDKKSKKDKIAVIYAQGAIQPGKSDGVENMGSETITEALRKARKDSTVKAIVLRVNSPGGSALASDEIWRETVLAREAKPFVVSMGDYAASGGYYISAAAQRIFVQPATITGSIGVFGLIPNARGFFNNKLGITFDGVKTNAHSRPIGIDRPLEPLERKRLEESIDRIYDTFLNLVAEGRGMTPEEVNALAGGRVWSGVQALENGLVDEFGGLNDAVAYAAELAEIEDYKKAEYPEQKDPFEEFFKNFFKNAEASYLRFTLGEEYLHYRKLNEAKKMTGIQARLPFDPVFTD